MTTIPHFRGFETLGVKPGWRMYRSYRLIGIDVTLKSLVDGTERTLLIPAVCEVRDRGLYPHMSPFKMRERRKEHAIWNAAVDERNAKRFVERAARRLKRVVDAEVCQ